jgi:hypothetical protein
VVIADAGDQVLRPAVLFGVSQSQHHRPEPGAIDEGKADRSSSSRGTVRPHNSQFLQPIRHTEIDFPSIRTMVPLPPE